jgi:hypothetical protein
MFYITSTNEDTQETTVIYEGTFIMSDSVDYAEDMSESFETLNTGSVEIIRDDNREKAVVTRRQVGS